MIVPLISDLISFMRGRGKDLADHPARDTTLSDLRSTLAVIIGSFDDEWAMRLGTNLCYRFRNESDLGLRWIEDTSNPTNKKWAINLSAPYDQIDNDFALVSRIQDQTTEQWWIGIAGWWA